MAETFDGEPPVPPAPPGHLSPEKYEQLAKILGRPTLSASELDRLRALAKLGRTKRADWDAMSGDAGRRDSLRRLAGLFANAADLLKADPHFFQENASKIFPIPMSDYGTKEFADDLAEASQRCAEYAVDIDKWDVPVKMRKKREPSDHEYLVRIAFEFENFGRKITPCSEGKPVKSGPFINFAAVFYESNSRKFDEDTAEMVNNFAKYWVGWNAVTTTGRDREKMRL